MTQPTAQPLDLAPIQARQHLVLDPDACGTCRNNVAGGQHPEHEQCNRRAMLLPAPDQLDWEELLDVPEDERANLPARFHTPVWEGNATPNAWLCAVCWGDGWVSQWPCATATAKGGEVFAAQHHGERARWDGAQLIAEVLRLRELLATAEAIRYQALTEAADWFEAGCPHLGKNSPFTVCTCSAATYLREHARDLATNTNEER